MNSIEQLLLSRSFERTSVPIKARVRIVGGKTLQSGQERIVELSKGKDGPSIQIYSPLELLIKFDPYRINQFWEVLGRPEECSPRFGSLQDKGLEITAAVKARFEGMLERAVAYFTSPQMAWITSQFNGYFGSYTIEIDGQEHYAHLQGGCDFENPGPSRVWSHFLLGNFLFGSSETSMPIARFTLPVLHSAEERASQFALFISLAAPIISVA